MDTSDSMDSTEAQLGQSVYSPNKRGNHGNKATWGESGNEMLETSGRVSTTELT